MKFFDIKKLWIMVYASSGILMVVLGIATYAVVKYEKPRIKDYITRDNSNSHVEVTNTVIRRKLNSIGELATYEYTYEGYITREADKQWVILNNLTKSTVEIDYEGTIKAGISVGDIDINVDDDDMVIYLTMPRPTIISNEIEITNYEENVAWFGSVEGNTASNLTNSAKEEELEEAIDQGLYRNASENAEQIISDLLSVYDEYELVFIDYAEGLR